MNEPTKKQPVDELFARKLANLSLPTNERGFARLQARMDSQVRPEKIVFWQNSTFQRSIAAAACLILVATLGWYAQSNKSNVGSQRPVAHQPKLVLPTDLTQPDTQKAVAQQTHIKETSTTLNKAIKKITIAEKQPVEFATTTKFKTATKGLKMPAMKALPVDDNKAEGNAEERIAAVTPTPTKENTVASPIAATARTLVVTIAEPDVLVAARQTAQEADQKIVAVNKNTSETGAGKLWRKIQKIRTGEAAVAGTATEDDEKGLLDRAYGQLKHSFQKNKPARQ